MSHGVSVKEYLELLETAGIEIEEKEVAKPETKTNHMDFEDEDEAVPFATPTRGRTPGGPKGSARKKTTSLDNVLSNMRRHRIEEKEYAEEQKKS